MKYLLDTHTFLWFLSGDKNLSKKAKKAIENADKNFVSIASLFELSIKLSLNKLDMYTTFDATLAGIRHNKFQLLDIFTNDVKGLVDLPFYHRDPFDRILILQAQNHHLTLISKDKLFKEYDVAVLW